MGTRLFQFRQTSRPVICIAKGWKPKACVSVKLRLAFGPLDGTFQALAEESWYFKRRGIRSVHGVGFL